MISLMIDGQTRRRYRCVNLLIVMSFLASQVVMGEVTSAFFKKREVCGVSQRLLNGCMEEAATSSQSRTECALLCQQNSATCLGVVLNNDTGSCYMHYDCGALEDTAVCTGADAVFTGFERVDSGAAAPVPSPCHNGGTWIEASSTCQCGPYATGNLCETLPDSCKQLRDWGVSLGLHWADMNIQGNPVKAKVKCELGSDFVHTFVSHSNGSSDFNYNATFQEYTDGFYKGDAAFWVGLENIHRLTQAGVDDFVIILDIGGVEVKKTYTGFVVSDASTHYAVDVDAWDYESNSLFVSIGRCLPFAFPFSTWDEDHDGESALNVAARAGTGWWYESISSKFCNLNGIKPLDSSSKIEYINVEWIDMTTSGYGSNYESTTLYLEQAYP